MFIGLLDRDGLRHGLGLGSFVESEFAVNHKLDREDVFTLYLS